MKDTRSIEIKVGLVSILAVILFIIGITLGRGLYVSVNPVTVKIRFPNSGNIQICFWNNRFNYSNAGLCNCCYNNCSYGNNANWKS